MRETIAGLELLQRRYLIVNWRTPNDFPKIYATLMDRMDAVTAVYAHSGQAAHIRYRYFLPIACDYISETGRFIAWKYMAMATGGLSDKEKIRIILSGVNEKVHQALEKSGFYELLGAENICSNINEAVAKAKEEIVRF